MTTPEGRLLNAAYRVASEPTESALARSRGTHMIGAGALRELLEALRDMLPESMPAAAEIRRQLAALERAGF